MSRFFQLDNPVWRFIGNLADLFLLSVFWYLCCIPVITIGSGTTAMYYVTLKLSSNQEGYTARSFLRSFRENFGKATVIWLLFLLGGLILGADFIWSLTTVSIPAKAMLLTFTVVAVLYVLCLTLIFPLLARCENTVSALLRMGFAMSVRNFLPVLSAAIVTAGIFLTGLFLFWPLLLIAPGLSAYLNSYLFNHIFVKYNLNLPD